MCSSEEMSQNSPLMFKYSFLSALIIGTYAHITPISNILTNWDGLRPTLSSFYLISQGKWLWPAISALFGHVRFGSADGVLALLLVSLSSGFLTLIFDIRSKINACLLGAIMMLFPSVMCTFVYPGEQIFFTSLLLSVMGVWIAKIKKYGCLYAIPILTLSLGIYPAYISVAASSFALLCIIKLLRGNAPTSEVISDGIKYATTLIISILCYYFILQLVLAHYSISLSSYRGIKEALSTPTINGFLQSSIGAYQKVLLFFFNDAYGSAGLRFIFGYRLTIVIILVLILFIIKNNHIYYSLTKMSIILVLLAIFPFALHLIAILGQNSNTHWIMIYSFNLVFLFPILLIDRRIQRQQDSFNPHLDINRIEAYCKRFVIFTVLVNLFNWYVITNQGYARLIFAYEGAYAQTSKIANDITGHIDYSSDTPVAILGKVSYKDDFNFMNKYTGIASKSFLISPDRITWMLNNFICFKFKNENKKKIEEIQSTNQYKNMPVFPYSGYVKNINGTIVVKISK